MTGYNYWTFTKTPTENAMIGNTNYRRVNPCAQLN